MREIKFRGKRVDGKGWVIGLPKYNSYGRIGYICGFFDVDGIDIYEEYEVIPSTVGQYTGLKDCKGNEIYEGDILSYKSGHPKHDGKIFKNVVEFATGQSLCGWRMRNKSCVVKATPYKFSYSEIIGSVFDNPELLTTPQGIK